MKLFLMTIYIRDENKEIKQGEQTYLGWLVV